MQSLLEEKGLGLVFGLWKIFFLLVLKVTINSWDFPNQNWIWILPAVARLMRKSELTESHIQGLDLDQEIHTQSTGMTTNIKKDVIKGTNLLRSGYL